jgi:hypothetical protein
MNRSVSSRSLCTVESLERRALFAATISGIVLQDVSGNGFSIDDPGLSGVVVKLYEDVNGNAELDAADGAAIASQASAADGRFEFTGLAVGKYILEDVLPANHVRVEPLFSDTIAIDVTKPNGEYDSNVFVNYVKTNQLADISNVSYTINGTTTVSTLLGNVQQGDTVTANFTVKAGKTIELSLVAYKADAPYSSAENLQYQKIADLATGVFTAGPHSLTVVVPDCYFQVDFVIGKAIDPFGPAGSHILYGAQNRLISFANGGTEPCECESTGTEGLTPGFWKNHTDLWVTYSPNQTLESIFDVPDHLGLDDKTLLEALNFGGGGSVKGAAQNLFRHAVAAILNASHPLVDYALAASNIITHVNTALASNSASTINTLKNQLDEFNNAGGGIDAHGNEI